MGSPEVRSVRTADRAELLEVFVRAGEGTPAGALWGDPLSEAAIYLLPYLELEPETFYVAVVDGRIVGYLTGCLDGAQFPSEEERIERAVREHGLLRRFGPVRFFFRASMDVAIARLRRRPTAAGFDDPRWPSHFHINVVAEARGTGVAQALISAWEGWLNDQGSAGCHLQTLTENGRALAFFRSLGFVSVGEAVLVPGLRHDGGHVHQQTMVRPPPSQA